MYIKYLMEKNAREDDILNELQKLDARLKEAASPKEEAELRKKQNALLQQLQRN